MKALSQCSEGLGSPWPRGDGEGQGHLLTELGTGSSPGPTAAQSPSRELGSQAGEWTGQQGLLPPSGRDMLACRTLPSLP